MAAPVMDASTTLTAGHAELDVLLDSPLTPLSDGDLLEAVRAAQTLRNRLAAYDNQLIAELEARGVAALRGQKDTASLLAGLIRLSKPEAVARVRAAHRLGPRRQFATGEPIDAEFPQAAAAQVSGALSDRHAKVIVDCIRTLPADIREDVHDAVETLLVREATELDPSGLVQVGQQVHAYLNPDGSRPSDEQRRRDRGLDIHVRPDGSSRLRGDLTAEATERLRTVLDALTHPRNLAADDTEADEIAPDGEALTVVGAFGERVKDPRSATQRRHDAFLAALTLMQQAAQTPTAGGVHTTVLLTMTTEAWLSGTGLARTGHDVLIPARDAVEWAGGNPQVIAVALDTMDGITGYSHLQRCYTEPQRLAMLARDGGCTFPGCDAPIWYCEADHLTPWADTGRTAVDDGHLVCSSHHRRSRPVGWTPVMINGRPAWLPPPWLDPDQEPRYNRAHPATSLENDLGLEWVEVDAED